jgi:hypothetical protein
MLAARSTPHTSQPRPKTKGSPPFSRPTRPPLTLGSGHCQRRPGSTVTSVACADKHDARSAPPMARRRLAHPVVYWQRGGLADGFHGPQCQQLGAAGAGAEQSDAAGPGTAVFMQPPGFVRPSGSPPAGRNRSSFGRKGAAAAGPAAVQRVPQRGRRGPRLRLANVETVADLRAARPPGHRRLHAGCVPLPAWVPATLRAVAPVHPSAGARESTGGLGISPGAVCRPGW